MWIRNEDTGKWSSQIDSLTEFNFTSWKRDMSSYRLYQKCLSGALYNSINGFDDIYNILSEYVPRTWYVGITYSTPMPYIPVQANKVKIDGSSIFEYYDQFLAEDGLTMKTLFTPKRLLSDSVENYYTVDVTTTEMLIDIIGVVKINLTIDGIKLVEGHRVLVKDQIAYVTLPNSTDPETYFKSNYYVYSTNSLETVYSYYTSENGIYVYKGNKLVRDPELDNYDVCIKYSVLSKLGNINKQKQFHLSRLLDGYFPTTSLSQPIEFKEGHNYVLRNQVDYNNLFEISYQDVIKHATQSIYLDGVTYSIPNRTIAVGEFGIITNYQEGAPTIIENKYKVLLKSIVETNNYYWICGDYGTLLRVSKIDFSIKRIEIGVLTRLNSIDFYNESRGVVVGKYNIIYVTDDGGYNWTKIDVREFESFNYNVVLYPKVDKIFIGGDTGVFLELTYDHGTWISYKRRISKFNSIDDEYILVENINDIYVDKYNANDSTIAIVCNNNTIFLYDTTNYYGFNFICPTISPNIGDINSIDSPGDGIIYLSSYDGTYMLDLSLFSLTSSVFSNVFYQLGTVSKVGDFSPNSISNFESEDLIITGEKSLFSVYGYTGSSQSLYLKESIDVNYDNRLKSRLLFMDYDIGSKLNFFDDLGEYRLPNTITFTASMLDSSFLEFTHLTQSNVPFSVTESNWVTYWKDRSKTFEYYTHMDDVYKVEPNFTFSYSDICNGTFEYATPSISTNLLDIIQMAPNIDISTQSRYIDTGGTIFPNNSYSIYAYDYLLIWALSTTDVNNPPEVGDMVNISSDCVEAVLMINKIIKNVSMGVTTYYQYIYTDFNQNILNNLTKSPVRISNLNKYSNNGYQEFVDKFNLHPAHHAYKATIDYGINDSNVWTNQWGGVWNLNRICYDFIITPLFPYTVVPVPYNCETTFSLLNSNGIFIGGTWSFTQNDVNISLLTPSSGTETISYGTNTLTIQNAPYTDTYPVSTYTYSFIDQNNLLLELQSPSNKIQNLYFSRDGQITISPRFTNFSSYYNLQTGIEIGSNNFEMRYSFSFFQFGYNPTYNLLDYLSSLNYNNYFPTRELSSLPVYGPMPGTYYGSFTGATDSNIYTEFASANPKWANKLFFGKNLKDQWTSILKWTFVDVSIEATDLSIHTTEKLLVMDKYYDSTYDWYVIEFHKMLDIPLYANQVQIRTRRTLQEISDDLQYLNTLHRNKDQVKSIESLYSYTNYETDINFKIPTDSYAKAFLSDDQFVKDLSGLVYVDYKNELALDITKLEIEYITPITNTNFYIDGSNTWVLFNCSNSHHIGTGDGVVISMTGGPGSSEELNQQYMGYHVAYPINTQDFYIKIPYGLPATVTDYGSVTFIQKDPFLNFQPINIFDIGQGPSTAKQSVKIDPENYELDGSKYNLIDVDMSKYCYQLTDGLTFADITNKYPWILDAEIKDAIIGLDSNKNIQWYKGIWNCGRWFGGHWLSGTWLGGDWYRGTWESKSLNIVNPMIIQQSVATPSDSSFSKWYDGRWFDGEWKDGTWYYGRSYGGTWSNGIWYNGIWNNGTWEDGEFSGGIWVNGTWKDGLFNTDNTPSYWLDGKWYGGDFENGMWYDGLFDQKYGKISRFGTKSYNSRTSTWHGGKWLNGQFHSQLNLDENGFPIVSDIHKYSIWRTGFWGSGDFWGGIAYNIDFKGGEWRGGILEDIQLIGINSATSSLYGNTFSNYITLNGIFKFNVGDEFWIIDNEVNNSYSPLGSNDSPRRCKALFVLEEGENTHIVIDVKLSYESFTPFPLGINISNTNTGLRVVSKWTNAIFDSGIWTNGILDNSHFNGGIWYNGVVENSSFQ